MSRFRGLALACVVSLCALSACDSTTGDAPVLKINEVMARNRQFAFTDVNGAHLDWAEIFNPTDLPVSLAGFTLTDNARRPSKYRFPGNRVLQPGEHLVVFLASTTDIRDFQVPDPTTGEAKVFQRTELHADFGVSSTADTLFLFANEGQHLVDRIEINNLATDMSVGRFPDGADNFGPIFVPTPSAENVITGLKPSQFVEQPRVGRPTVEGDCSNLSMRFTVAQDGSTELLPDVLVEITRLDTEEGCDFFSTSTPLIVEAGSPVSIAERVEDADCDVALGRRASALVVDGAPVDPDDGCRRDAEGQVVAGQIRELAYQVTLPPEDCLTTLVLIRVLVDDGVGLNSSRPFCYVYGGEDPPLVISEYQPKNETTIYAICANCVRDVNCCVEDCSVLTSASCREECETKCQDFGEPFGKRRVLTPDWLEIHNYGDEPIDLTLFGLRGRIEGNDQNFLTWTFGASTEFDPLMTSIEAGGYRVVFADADDGQGRRIYYRLEGSEEEGWIPDTSRNWYSAGFRLNPSRGTPDEVLLQSDSGIIIDRAVLDFSEYAAQNGLDPESELFFADRSAGRFPDLNPNIPEGATGSDRYPPGALAPGIVSECPTIEAANSAECDLDVAPRFNEIVSIFPRCPEVLTTLTARTQFSVDRDANVIEPRAVFRIESGADLGSELDADEVRVAPLADQSAAPLGTLLYELIASLDVPSDAVYTVRFELHAEIPTGGAWDTELNEESLPESTAQSFAFATRAHADQSLEATGLRFNEALPHNVAVDVPGAVAFTFPDYLELHLPADSEVDVLDLSDYFLAREIELEAEDSPIRSPREWRFPEGTVIARGEYLTLVFQAEATPSPGILPVAEFSLDGCGEAVYLIGPDSGGNCIVETMNWWGDSVISCIADGNVSSADDQALGSLCDDVDVLLQAPTPGTANSLPPLFVGVTFLPIFGEALPNRCSDSGGFTNVRAVALVDRQVDAAGEAVREAFLELEDGTRHVVGVTPVSPLPDTYPDFFEVPSACLEAEPACYTGYSFSQLIPAPSAGVAKYRVGLIDACGRELSPCTDPNDPYCFRIGSLGDAGSAAEGILITEINRRSALPGDPGGSNTRHWIELANRSGVSVDISGMSLSNDERMPRLAVIPDGVTMAPGEVLILASDGQIDGADLEIDLPWAQITPDGIVRCRESGQIFLFDSEERGSCLLDQVAFEFPPLGGADPDLTCEGVAGCIRCDPRSLVRLPDSDEFVLSDTPSPGVFEASFEFLRGDANSTGKLEITDAVGILQTLFQGAFHPCFDVLDADDTGVVNLSDAAYLLAFLFGSGNPPPPPFPALGVDPTPDDLDCAAGTQ